MEKITIRFHFFVVWLVASCAVSNVKSQQPGCNIHKLIGLMDFNIGPQRIPDDLETKNQITFFYPRDTMAIEQFNKGLEELGWSLEDFSFQTIKTSDGESGPIINSKKYKAIFDDFFKFKFQFVSYQKDEENGHRVYFLQLKKSKFKTICSKLKFLEGLFIRYGNIDKNGAYQYKINTSKHNRKIMISFLRDTGSKLVRFKANDGSLTPGSSVISFIPSPELKKALD